MRQPTSLLRAVALGCAMAVASLAPGQIKKLLPDGSEKTLNLRQEKKLSRRIRDVTEPRKPVVLRPASAVTDPESQKNIVDVTKVHSGMPDVRSLAASGPDVTNLGRPAPPDPERAGQPNLKPPIAVRKNEITLDVDKFVGGLKKNKYAQGIKQALFGPSGSGRPGTVKENKRCVLGTEENRKYSRAPLPK